MRNQIIQLTSEFIKDKDQPKAYSLLDFYKITVDYWYNGKKLQWIGHHSAPSDGSNPDCPHEPYTKRDIWAWALSHVVGINTFYPCDDFHILEN